MWQGDVSQRPVLEVTEYINCSFGVRQGDARSPVLYFLFINELALDVINNGRRAATICKGRLPFADDVAFICETVLELQTKGSLDIV